MPIYEFYCSSCHTVFSFFSARIDTQASPACPKCRRPELPRRPSSFAALTGRGSEEEGEDAFLDGLDESRLEGAMGAIMGELDQLGEDDDPRALARVMRRFGDLSGLELGERMEEYVARLEAGEDPESLEREMEAAGDDLGGELGDENFDDFFKAKKAVERSRRKPRVDETLYFL